MNTKRVAMCFYKGIIRTVAGAAVFGVCAMSVVGFYRVAHDSGYLAVLDFVGAMAMLAASAEGIYFLGGGHSNKSVNYEHKRISK